MAGQDSVARLWTGMFVVAVGFLLLTLWNTALNPAPTGWGRIAGWLAVGGALAMTITAGAMVRRGGQVPPEGPNPGPAAGIIAGMTGVLGVLSTVESTSVVLTIGVVGATAGLVGGILLFWVSWRRQ